MTWKYEIKKEDKYRYPATLFNKLNNLAKHANHVAYLLSRQHRADTGDAYKEELDRLLEGVEKSRPSLKRLGDYYVERYT